MIPNPNAPDKYKYETDYRKIPREYLNPRIPQGRGKIKWQAFATLPEQFEILNKIIQNQDKTEKPILTEDTWDSINYIFQLKVKNDELCSIVYWENGHLTTYIGKILKMDEIDNTFSLYDSSNNIYKLNNDNVCSIT
ncbi:YolD-like family protein [Staphylococcus arlettae]|uniref:YolD-like family protein n=1 Tax=Staphylococcus TaxID=1279 RepID=UPI0010744344|nr:MULTISPECIES: YolD-like family protein [Staphylococcus]MBF0814487.1 YolD-like family protein [Staphylococcus saprophyticus]MDW4418669.1 YolD-like family protein [Staphylococcus saprophyticus]TFV21644.1 YolD-like family protein [Staphylococcus saprophyticus]HDK7582136.1 YolD-like family protein [Staphylococcus aureus]